MSGRGEHRPLRVLVAGRDGQLARALVPAFAGAGWRVSALGRADGLDLAGSPSAIVAAVRSVSPDLVVNAAAYTAVDRAESEPDAALAVNRDGAGALAAAAHATGAPVLHVSTDYVFDGDKGAPYTETDRPTPIGAYGRSKLEGERAVLAANPRSAVVRTSWVVSATGQNFLRTMLRLAETRDEVSVVNDQRGAPTFASDLAAAALRMAPRLLRSPAGDEAFGVFHLSGAPDTTWHGFAAAVFAGAASRGQKVPKLNAIPTSAYPTPTRRPADSRLDCSRILAVHCIARPDWRPSLERCLGQLLHAEASVPA
ncbi:dTDP-4-dehydrorhamnose reductase [Craurococcus roseus]|uniref:dTDP-4-dehydrorhamnose reductase n=1 Tax=Craurococcus roseus TaxID=77585 RepID=A0ABN1FFF7_9PROT